MIWHRTICTTATYVHLVHDGADYCWCHSLHANGLLWPWCWLLVAMLYLLLWKKRYDFFISTVRCSVTHSIHPSRTLIATRWYIRYNFQSHQPLKSSVSSSSYYSSSSMHHDHQSMSTSPPSWEAHVCLPNLDLRKIQPLAAPVLIWDFLANSCGGKTVSVNDHLLLSASSVNLVLRCLKIALKM